MNQRPSDTTRIFCLNIDRRLSRLIDLSKQTTKYLPVVVCIQDMISRNTGPKEEAVSLLFPGYKETTHKDLTTLTLNTVTSIMETKSYTNEGTISILMTRLKVNDQHDETIVNIYIRPKATPTETMQALDWISRQAKNMSRIVIVGDVNASGYTWDEANAKLQIENNLNPYTEAKITRGKVIEKWIARYNLTCLNEDRKPSTYQDHEERNKSIDIGLIGTKSKRKWQILETIEHKQQGHAIIVIRTTSKRNKLNTQRPTREKIDINRITDQHINTIKNTIGCRLDINNLHTKEQLTDHMNDITNELCSQVVHIQKQITRRVRCGGAAHIKRASVTKKLAEQRTQAVIERLKRVERKRPKRQNKARKAKDRKKKRILHQKIIDKILKAHQRDTPGTDAWEHWRHNNKCEIDASQTNLNQIKSKEDIERLAKIKFPASKRNLTGMVCRPTREGIRISIEESNKALDKLRNKKYNTPDGIKMSVFYAIANKVPEVLHTIASLSFITCTVPKKAEHTQGTIIPKKVPGQFRIVHVSNPIAAYLELIALARLNYRLETNNLLGENQYGFTALRSRHDLIARILEYVLRRKEWGRSTCLISTDIEGAFDNIDQTILIDKLQREINDSALTMWIASFLQNRKISIRQGQIKSQYRTVCQGVPQGSALGPVLWNFSIHDIETAVHRHAQTSHDETKLLKYADDVYLITAGEDTTLAQKSVNNFTKAIEELKLRVRPSKCSYMIMNEPESILKESPRLTIEGVEIEKTTSMNILGVKIGSNGRIIRNDENLVRKLTDTAQVLNKLKRTRVIQNNKQWRTLIEGLILSRTVSNCWPALIRSAADRESIMKLTLKTIKIAFGWPLSTPNKPIKLIFDIREPMTTISKMTINRFHLETGPAYMYLMKTQKQTSPQIHRRYHNPDMILNKIERYPGMNPAKLHQGFRYIIERAKFAALVKVDRGAITPELIITAWHNTGPYAHTLVTLSKAAEAIEHRNMTLVINGQCAIMQAIKNLENHDQRIIHLRESIHKAGWKLITIDGDHHRNLKRAVDDKLKNIRIHAQIGSTEHNAEEWIRANIEATGPPLDHTHGSMATKEPDMLDYRIRLLAKKKYKFDEQLERLANRTTICKKIENKPEKWMRLNPSYLEGEDMMMLGGVIRDPRTDKLRKDEPTNECTYCGKSDIEPKEQELEHRISTCKQFKHKPEKKLLKRIKQITRIALFRERE